ncbi:MAG: hypothetical protein LBN11_05100 [Tannerella sp.]|jgi:hypothetical protein|nr:hypothetical protein [Tannerella sp.]
MMNKAKCGYFSDDDSVLEAPESMRVKLVLTMLRKQDAYIAALEKNIEILIAKGNECSSLIAHFRKRANIEQHKNVELTKQIETLNKEKKRHEARITSLELLLSKISEGWDKIIDDSLPKPKPLKFPKVIAKIDIDGINQITRPPKKTKEQRKQDRINRVRARKNNQTKNDE